MAGTPVERWGAGGRSCPGERLPNKQSQMTDFLWVCRWRGQQQQVRLPQVPEDRGEPKGRECVSPLPAKNEMEKVTVTAARVEVAKNRMHFLCINLYSFKKKIPLSPSIFAFLNVYNPLELPEQGSSPLRREDC